MPARSDVSLAAGRPTGAPRCNAPCAWIADRGHDGEFASNGANFVAYGEAVPKHGREGVDLVLGLPPGAGEIDAPEVLEDPRTLATGAVVATLLAHRDWVRGHDERVEIFSERDARRQVTVDFELPRIVWAAAPNGVPVVAPLGLLPKGARASVDVRDEAGERAALLPGRWSAGVAAAGLLALARSAGANGDGELALLAWRVTRGESTDARDALAELARGESAHSRRAWAHRPFRDAAMALADHAVLLVALPDADRRRTLTYEYDERLPSAEEPPARGVYGRLSARLGWEGLRVRLPLAHFGDSRSQRLVVGADADVDASAEVREDLPVANVHITAPRPQVVRLGPAVALLGALLMTAGWLAAPAFGDDPSVLAGLVLAAPAVLAAYLARRPESPLVGALVRGARVLLLIVALLSLAGEAVLSSGASTPVLRVGTGVAAALLWMVAALLLETRRRARGGARPAPPSQRLRRSEPAARGADTIGLALLACAMGAGLMLVALADDAARDGRSGADVLLWAGLAAIFVPAVVYTWRAPPRTGAVIGVILLGVALYLVKVLHSPLDFTSHDEFSTLRTTLDLQRFGQPFEANPLIPVHPFYPAIELATMATSSVTGLSTFVSGLVVIGVLRVALMAALFLVFESAASTRVAALATVLYACNPNFVFFDSQWAYESFALPLAAAAVAIAARGTRAAWLAAPIVAALCVSHPLTTIALIAFLAVWAAIDAASARREGRSARRELWMLASFGALCMTVWAVFVARGLGGYLGPVIGDAGNSLVDLLLGESGPKRIFGAAGAGDTPLAERLLAFAAVLLALAAIAFGVRSLWRRFTPLGGALAAAALLYPLTLPLRLTEAGTEISDRASEFVFVGVAFVAALALCDRAPLRGVASGAIGRLATPLVAVAAAVALAGGVVIGTARWSRLPGDYLVLADSRSIEPEGRDAARWARSELGPGNRIATDRINGLLMGSVGLQEPQVGEILGRPVPRLFTARRFDEDTRFTLVNDKIGYLVADKRISTALPAVGFYFDREEPGAYHHKRPPDLAALLKYDTVCPIGRVFDSGNVVVYDTRLTGRGYPCPGRRGRGGP